MCIKLFLSAVMFSGVLLAQTAVESPASTGTVSGSTSSASSATAAGSATGTALTPEERAALKEKFEWEKEKEMEIVPEFPKWLRDQWKEACKAEKKEYNEIKKCYEDRLEKARASKRKQITFDEKGNPLTVKTEEPKKSPFSHDIGVQNVNASVDSTEVSEKTEINEIVPDSTTTVQKDVKQVEKRGTKRKKSQVLYPQIK